MILWYSMTIIQNPAMNEIWNKLHINDMFSGLSCFIDVVDSHAHCEFIVMFICPIFGCLFLACTHASHPLNEHQNMIIFLGETLDFAYLWHVDVITHCNPLTGVILQVVYWRVQKMQPTLFPISRHCPWFHRRMACSGSPYGSLPAPVSTLTTLNAASATEGIAQDAYGFRIQVLPLCPSHQWPWNYQIWNSQVTSITFKIYYNLLSCMHLWSHLPFSRLEVTALKKKKHVSVRVAAASQMSMSVSKLDAPKNPSSTNPGPRQETYG